MSFENETEFIKIRHKESGKEYTNRGTDFFNFDHAKFDVVAGGTACLSSQRTDIYQLLQMTNKNIVDLLNKYNRKTLKDFTFDEAEGIIKFLQSLCITSESTSG